MADEVTDVATTPVTDTAPDTTDTKEESRADLVSSVNEKISQLSAESDAKPDTSEDIPATTAESAPSQPANGFDEELLADAEVMGVPREAALAFGSPSRLLQFLGSLIQNDQPPEGMTQQEQEDWEDEFGDDTWEEPLKKFGGRTRKEIAELKAEVDELRGLKGFVDSYNNDRKREYVTRLSDDLDTLFEETDNNPAFVGMFGKQKRSGLVLGSVEHQNRLRITAEAKRQALGYRAAGEPVPDLKVLFKRALMVEFGDSMQAQERKQIAGQAKRRQSQILPRANMRNEGTIQSGRSAAIAAANRKLAAVGAG